MVEAGPRSRARGDRRLVILDRATELFDERGYSGTTTQDIADAAQITKKTLYRYMPSKEDILYEIHSRFIDDRAPTDAVGSDGLITQIAAFMRHHTAVVIDHGKEIRVFFEEMKHLSPEKRAGIIAKRDAYERIFIDLLEAGAASGELRVREPAVTARLVLGGLTEIYRWFRPDGPMEVEEFLEIIVHSFLRGIAAEPVHLEPPGSDSVPPVRGLDELVEPPMSNILVAATRLLSTRGYQQSSTQELADEAGVTKGALFYHVRHKEEILYHIQSLSADEAIRVVDAAKADDVPSVDVLNAMAAAHCAWLVQYRGASAVASEEMKYLSAEHHAEILVRQEAYTEMFRTALVRGLHRDELAFGDVRVVAGLLLGMLNSIYRWYRPGGRVPPLALGTLAVSVLLNGIAPRA